VGYVRISGGSRITWGRCNWWEKKCAGIMEMGKAKVEHSTILDAVSRFPRSRYVGVDTE
jgi:hypothetical protein